MSEIVEIMMGLRLVCVYARALRGKNRNAHRPLKAISLNNLRYSSILIVMRRNGTREHKRISTANRSRIKLIEAETSGIRRPRERDTKRIKLVFLCVCRFHLLSLYPLSAFAYAFISSTLHYVASSLLPVHFWFQYFPRGNSLQSTRID